MTAPAAAPKPPTDDQGEIEMTQPALDIATRDRIAADALRWAADRIDPGSRNMRPKPLDETHDVTMRADRGAATNLRFWADQIERGYIEPRPAGSAPHVTDPAPLQPRTGYIKPGVSRD